MMRNIVIQLFLITTCIIFLTGINNAQNLSGNLQPGKYSVGFKVIKTYDYSRTYQGKQGRPMQIAVWYPTDSKTPRMEFSEYLKLYPTEESLAEITEKERQENIEFWKKEISGRVKSAIDTDKVIQAKTHTVKDAKAAIGKFPVIIYGAGGQGEAFENCVLFEYLASHGYFILASPAVGIYDHKTIVNAVGLEAEARDMEFLIAQAQQFPEADLSRLGTMGWSWGGLSAMLVQMRNPNVDAVLSLDGSIAMHEDKIRQTAFFDPNKIRVPHMFISTRRNVPRVNEFLELVKYADASLLDFDEITHSELNSYNFIARNFTASLDESEKKKQKAYELICNYALQFFNASLKNDVSAKHFLKQVSPAKDLLSITRKDPLPLPPTQDEFFEIIRKKDFETAEKLYKEIKARDAHYQIFEAWEMTVLADQLYREGRNEDAIKSAKLRIEAYPNDYLSYEWLANLYYRMKDWQNALEYFSMAYGMALREKQTPEILSELDFYRKRIETVKNELKN
jgi:tetratricopeptide (TPR) repeat protein